MAQMLVRFFTGTAHDCILRCFQLHDHTSETLGEGVVDVPRHSISFFKDCGPLTLLGEIVELKREHDLVRQCLGQFDFLRPIRSTIDVANANKASDLSSHQKRHCEKPLCAVSFQMFTPIAANARISVDVIANHGTCGEKQFLNYCGPFPK